MRNISGKDWRENQNLYIMFNNFSENHAVYNTTTGRMHIECWKTTATDTHLEYFILIAFPRRQWLRERVSTLLL